MGMPTFGEIVFEHFNMEDRNTLDILTSINEVDQSNVLKSLTNKLYNAIVDKVDDIDFGNIPATKGDITLIENYSKLVECTELIKEIVLHYNQNPAPVQSVLDAMENIRTRRPLFEKVFALDLEFGKTIYNTMVLSCVSAVSFLIATSIEYVKSSDNSTFDIALNKVAYVKTKDGLLFKDLTKFNAACNNGEVDKAINYLIDSHRKNFVGTGAAILSVSGIIVGSVIVIISIIPFIRELIYFFYLTKQNISDYFSLEADLLEMNASNIEYNNELTPKEKKKIIDKQKKIADRFRKVSNTFNIKLKKAENETVKSINNDKKKYNVDDVVDTMPDSAEVGGIF